MSVLSRSIVNGAQYDGEDLPYNKWGWPKYTWFQKRLKGGSMTNHRNYLQEAYDIAESKTSELGLRYLPEAAHIRALVEVIENQKRILEGISKELDGILKQFREIHEVYSENDFKVSLTD